jgi:hypothetical protein
MWNHSHFPTFASLIIIIESEQAIVIMLSVKTFILFFLEGWEMRVSVFFGKSSKKAQLEFLAESKPFGVKLQKHLEDPAPPELAKFQRKITFCINFICISMVFIWNFCLLLDSIMNNSSLSSSFFYCRILKCFLLSSKQAKIENAKKWHNSCAVENSNNKMLLVFPTIF